MIQNKLVSLVLTLTFLNFGCATSSTTDKSTDKDAFNKIKLGDSEDKIDRLLGKGEATTQTYNDHPFRILTYFDSNNDPKWFFTINPSTKTVVGKSLWPYPNYPLIERVLKEEFKGFNFKKYSPCHTNGDKDEILADLNAGIYIAVGQGHVVLASWETPELTKLKIQLLYSRCAILQTEKAP